MILEAQLNEIVQNKRKYLRKSRKYKKYRNVLVILEPKLYPVIVNCPPTATTSGSTLTNTGAKKHINLLSFQRFFFSFLYLFFFIIIYICLTCFTYCIRRF